MAHREAPIFLHTAGLAADGSMSNVLAQRQHLHTALRSAGARLESLPPPPGCEPLFVKERLLFCDSGWGRRAMMCSPDGDSSHEREWTKSLWGRGVLVEPGSSEPLSGSDVVWIPGRGALLGIRGASSPESAAAVERFLGVEVHAVEIEDARFSRLDLAISALEDGTILFCRHAFDPKTVRELERWVDTEMIEVPVADALEGGLRWVEVNGRIVLGHGAPLVQSLLARRGFSIQVLPLEQIQRLGRGASCLLARLMHIEIPLRNTGS